MFILFIGYLCILLPLKKYIQLAMKEYVYSLRSKESEKELKELIDIIKDFEIL